MDDDRRLFGLVVGGMLPVALAMLLVPLRDTVSSVNLALMMVVAVVVAASIGGRVAAVVAAVMAAAAFDFFHTQPYLFGQLVLVPTPGVGVPRHTRVAAIVIADLVSGALGSRV